MRTIICRLSNHKYYKHEYLSTFVANLDRISFCLFVADPSFYSQAIAEVEINYNSQKYSLLPEYETNVDYFVNMFRTCDIHISFISGIYL